jgi:hypothetical protein
VRSGKDFLIQNFNRVLVAKEKWTKREMAFEP